MTEELKPCTSCNGTSSNRTVGIENHCTTVPDWRACCIKCDIATVWFKDKQEAIAAWNTRHE